MNANEKLVTSIVYKDVVKEFVTVILLFKLRLFSVLKK